METKELLERELKSFDLLTFAENDPLGVVMPYKWKQDIEIAALFVAAISWGRRASIIKAAKTLMETMDSPYMYIMEKRWKNMDDNHCIYRTLNGKRFKETCAILYVIYSRYPSLEDYLIRGCSCDKVKTAIFFLGDTVMSPLGTGKSYNNPAFKRVCMLFRWLVRDLETWYCWDKSELYAVMDIHVLKSARKLGLLTSRTSNWKATEELTKRFREMDSEDPLKYDFALFNLSIKGHVLEKKEKGD